MNTPLDGVLHDVAARLNLPALRLADGEGVILADADGTSLTVDRDDGRDLLHLRLDLGLQPAERLRQLALPLLQAADDLPPPYAFAWDAEAGRLLLAAALPASQLTAATLHGLIDQAAGHRLQAQRLLQALVDD